MADDNGVFFSMAAPNTSRLDVLRAKVRSSQQKIVASSKNILQSQQREKLLSRGLDPSGAVVADVGEGSTVETPTSNGPLHMQQQQQRQDDSVTQLLQEQLRLVYADRVSLKAEVSTLQRKHREREASLQSEAMSFRYKYDVLKKEMELNENRQEKEDSDRNWDMRDDQSPQHHRQPSSPPKKDYFQFAFRRDGAFAGQATRHRRERHAFEVGNDASSIDHASDSANLLKLQDEIESFKAKEKNYTNEILFLQMEIQRIQLEQERLSDLDMRKPWLNDGTTLEGPKGVKKQSGGLEAMGTTTESHKDAGGNTDNNEVASQIDLEMFKALERTREDLVELQEVFAQLEEKNKQVEKLTRKLQDESQTREEKYMTLQRRNQQLEKIVTEQEMAQEEIKDDRVYLAKKCKDLEKTNRELQARYKELEEKANDILKKKEGTEGRNQELETQCNKFRAENQEFEQIYDEIYTRSNDLLRQNDELESRTKVLEAKNLALESAQAKLEGENSVQSQTCDSLKNKLVALSSLVDKKEKTVRITNGTTARSSELVVSMSHSLSLYDSIYDNPRVREFRIRTWPKEIAENVRRKNCKVICTMLDDDGDTIAVFDIEELKKLSTSVLFQSSDYAHQDKILMVLRWIPLGESHSAITYQLQPERSGILVRIMNGHSKHSRELHMPLSDSWTVFETVYNHEGVKAVIRKWPRDVAWRVTNRRSRIVCLASSGENEFAKYGIDDLESLTLRAMHQQAGIENADRISLVLVEEKVTTEDELYLPFRARGFRQRGWTLLRKPSRMKIRLKNETTQRSRDMIVLISSDLSLFDAVYSSDEVQRANVRKWKSKFVREVKTDLSRLLCVFLGDEQAEIRTCSVESLKTITTSDAKENLSNNDGSVSILLRCAKTKKGVEAARHEEMRLRIVNHTTRRTMFLYVPYSEKLTLYDSIYNNPEVRTAQVRMWPKEVLHAIKDETATIQCHLFDGQASENELQIFSIQKLKETSTKRLFDLIPSAEEVPQLVLKYHSVGSEKTEVMLHVSNEVTGRFKELEVPVSQDMTVYDIIYQNAAIKFSYVRMWPSDIVQKVKNKRAEILCILMGKEHEINFSIEDMKKTTISQLVELSPPPYDHIRLVLKYKDITNTEKETENAEIKEIQIRITNQTTGRFRDLTLPLSTDLSLYRSIYNNRKVKDGKVRVWPGNLLQDLKQKVVEVECAVVAASGQIVYTYTVDGMRNASTKDLFELVQRSRQRINLLLRCEATAYTGDCRGKLRERYRPRGFRQRGWLPKSSSSLSLQVRIRNEMTHRSVDLLLPALEFSSNLNDVIYENVEVLRRGVRRWPVSAAKSIKQGSSEVLCVCVGAGGSPIRNLTIKEMSETTIQQLLSDSHISERIDLSLRCVATSVVVIDVDGDDSMVEDEDCTHREKLPANTETMSAEKETPDEASILNADDRFLDITSSEEQIPNAEEVSKSGTSTTEDTDTVSDIVINRPGDGTTNSHFVTTMDEGIQDLDGKEIDIKTLGLYPEVFTALGFEAIQGQTKNQIFGIYPEVLDSLGFEAAKYHAAKIPNGVYPRGRIQTTANDQILGIYPEVLDSLGFEAAKENAAKIPNGVYPRGRIQTTANDQLLGIYPEVFDSLGFEGAEKNAEKELIGMYPGVFESLGFEVEATNTSELMQAIYPEVLTSLGFQVVESRELETTDDKEIESQSVSATSETISEEVEVPVNESMNTTPKQTYGENTSLSFLSSGIRQRGGWLPVKSGSLHFRARLVNETNGRSKDLIVPVSDSLTLFDAVYNEESVQQAKIRQFPSKIALAVKQKACEILADVFIPRYGPIDQSTSFFGDLSDILIDDEGTAIRSFTVDDFRQTTTAEIFELMSQPRDVIKIVLRVKKVEAVDLLESRLSALEQQLRTASEQAKSGSELLAEKLQALDEATKWNEQLSGELEELRAGVNGSKPSSPRNDMITKAKKQMELIEQKERALEQASERNESLKVQVAQLQKEIEILEVAANSSIMPDYKSVVDHVIEEEDDRDELSKDVSFKPIGFRQRGWRADESASMDMRLRVTNESTQKTKDFVLPIDDELTVFDAVYMDCSEEDILEKTSNIQCIAWHDMGKDVRTFSVNALKQMSTKRFFELTSRRQDLLKALIRCQETAKSQVQELESEVEVILVRNEELQNSMCVLSNELAASVAKYNKLKRELDALKQSQEGGLLFATDLFEI